MEAKRHNQQGPAKVPLALLGHLALQAPGKVGQSSQRVTRITKVSTPQRMSKAPQSGGVGVGGGAWHEHTEVGQTHSTGAAALAFGNLIGLYHLAFIQGLLNATLRV